MSLLFIDASAEIALIPGFVQDIREGSYNIGVQKQQHGEVHLPGATLIIFVSVLRRPFEALFGEQFRDAAGVLAIQLIGIMASLLGDPLVSVVVAEGKSKSVLVAAILGLGSSILMLVLLVPRSIGGIDLPGLGITGAAIAFATAFTVQLIYYRLNAGKIGTYISQRHFAITLAVPGLMAIALTRSSDG
jgi:O-antigen/teichoic acid export membrane protein